MCIDSAGDQQRGTPQRYIGDSAEIVMKPQRESDEEIWGEFSDEPSTRRRKESRRSQGGSSWQSTLNARWKAGHSFNPSGQVLPGWLMSFLKY